MRKLLYLYLFLFSISSIAQENLDSLLTIWKDPSRSNDDRVDAYSRYIRFGYIFSKPDSAALLAEALHVYANEHNYPNASSNGYNIQGIANSIQGKYDLALGFYEKGIAIEKELGNDKRVATALSNIGLIYDAQGNYPRALEAYQKSLRILGDKSSAGRGNALNNIGMIYLRQENYSSALEYYEKSLAVREEIGDRTGISNSFSNIGIVYGRLDSNRLALQYYEKSLAIAEELVDKRGIVGCLVNMGHLNYKEGDSVKALENMKKALTVSEEMGDHNTIARCYINIGTIYKNQGEYAPALKYCQKSLDLATEIGTLDLQQNACECLYDTYKLTGNNRKALEYFEQMTMFKDSLFNEKNTKKLTQLEMQYEFDIKEAATKAEQDKKDALAAQELERQKLVRNGFMGGFAVVLLFAGVFFVQRNKIGKEKERSENLLLNILPAEVAEELKEKGESEAKNFDEVSIIFTDFQSFTQTAEKLNAKELVDEINICFKAFDAITEKYGIEKIKTIGDAYMAAGGLNIPRKSEPKDVVKAALEMQAFMLEYKAEKLKTGSATFEMRVGVHTGPVVAGIVGVKKFQYDIWGDTVNTASRMESNSEVGKVNISEATYNYLKDDPDFVFESRGKINAKGKGEIEMYFVSLA